MSTSSYPKVFTQTHHKNPKALDGVGGGGVRGFNAHNKDLGKPSSGSIGPYPPPPTPIRVPMTTTSGSAGHVALSARAPATVG